MVAQVRPLTALIVDDDRSVRAAVGDVLRSAGHEPLIAASRDEALDVVRIHTIHFSILDVHVRSDDGLRIFGSLRQVVVGLPVIFMSGAFTPEIVARARSLGAHDCLDKPLDIGVLRRAVRDLIEQERL